MANVRRGSGAKGKRNPRPSAAEAIRTLNSFWEGTPVSGTRAEFNKIQKVIENTEDIDQFYDPTEYDNLAGLPATFDEYFDPTGNTPSSRPFYEVVDLTGDLRIPGQFGPQLEEDESPADLTLVPTSTTNYQRPRTLAAGYDEDEEKLTVMFRDGTLYNYYEVSKNEWQAFKSNRSKGAVIYRMLDFKPRGYADDSSISARQRKALYRYSRGAQINSSGKLAGQSGKKYPLQGRR